MGWEAFKRLGFLLLLTNSAFASGQSGLEGVQSQAESVLQGNLGVLTGGVGLILVAVFAWVVLKKFIENSILGLIILSLVWAFFPLIFAKLWTVIIPTLVLTILFGPAGIGAMLLAAWMGWI